jgi:hypothetical protein
MFVLACDAAEEREKRISALDKRAGDRDLWE